MIPSSQARFVLPLCFALCAGDARSDGSLEQTRYRELAESGAAFSAAVGAHRRGDFENAESGYRRAMAADPSFVEAIVNLARIEIERRDLSGAAALLDRAEARRPGYPGIDAARGLLALAAGDPSAAIEELSNARSKTPRDVEVLTNLAAALLLKDSGREAVEILEEAKRLDPHRPDTSFNLGLAFDHTGDTPRAIHHYRRYLGLAPRDDAQRDRVMERIDVLTSAGLPEPGAPRIRLHSSSPATSTRTVANGGRER